MKGLGITVSFYIHSVQSSVICDDDKAHILSSFKDTQRCIHAGWRTNWSSNVSCRGGTHTAL